MSKLRQGFVSNSSSSSFIISDKDLTAKQLTQLLNVPKEADPWDSIDLWSVKYDTITGVISGNTFLDNFSYSDYMNSIGIDMSKVTWERNA